VQWDLKAVLAYSTVSQLGLMFVGLGAGAAVGGKDAAMAHLFTHAFAKCLLFLCAGAVIHACHGCQDLARLGGLRKQMPVTAFVSLAALLALLGMPLFSGFVSKDAVLAAALAGAEGRGLLAHGPFVLAALGSLLTAAYMLRWWLRIFTGTARDHDVVHHAHDPVPSAKAMLLVLAPMTLALPWTLGDWLHLPHLEAHTTAMVVALSGLGLGGLVAFTLYGGRRAANAEAGSGLARVLAPLHRACSDLWGIDRLWDLLFVRGLGGVVARLFARSDLGSQERLATLETAGPAGALPALPSLDGGVDAVARRCGDVGRLGALAHQGRLGIYLALAVGIAAAWALWGTA